MSAPFSFSFGSSSAPSGFSFSTPAPSQSNQPQPQPQAQAQQSQSQSQSFSQSQPSASQSQLFSFSSSPPLSSSSSSSHRFERRLLSLRDSLDPNSRDCRFQFAFYNRLARPSAFDSAAASSSFSKPPHVSDSLWSGALANNPDPAQLTPVIAVGFADLQKRVAEQQKAAAAFRQSLDTIGASFDEMRHVHEALTKGLIAALRRELSVQAHRALCIASALEQQRSAGIPTLAEEVEFRRSLEAVERRLSRPGQFISRARELAASARLIREKSEAAALFHSSAGRSAVPLLSESNGSGLHEYLSGQTSSLDYLTQTAQADAATVNHIKQFNQTAEREKQRENSE